jgi:hypothetical protein
MPPVATEPPDTEVLDGTPFMSGGWPDGSISLDVGFSQVAEALGDGALLESATPETLLAVAFAAGDSARLLKITPIEFVTNVASGRQRSMAVAATRMPACQPTTRISTRRQPRTLRRSGGLSISSSPRTAS